MPRPISKFALTVPRFEYKDVLHTILHYELQASVYAISAETHTEANDSSTTKHLHAYFELDPDTADTTIDNVRQWLHSSFQAVAGEENAPKGFDIQSAKRPDKWLCYITKVGLLTLPNPNPKP